MSSKNQHSFDENFKLGKVLGKGAFGTVRAVKHVGSGKAYAAKITRLARVPHGFIHQIKNEAAVMQKLSHKNICKFHKPVDSGSAGSGSAFAWAAVPADFHFDSVLVRFSD